MKNLLEATLPAHSLYLLYNIEIINISICCLSQNNVVSVEWCRVGRGIGLSFFDARTCRLVVRSVRQLFHSSRNYFLASEKWLALINWDFW